MLRNPPERKARDRYRLQLLKLFPTLKNRTKIEQNYFNKHLKLIKFGIGHQDNNPKA